MNAKRIAAAAILASLAITVTPALSATTATQTITVKWNTTALAQLNVHTQYTTAFAHAGNANILVGENGGSGLCNGSAATTQDASADLTVNYGNVTPDTTKFTNCLEQGAVILSVATTSTNWTLGGAATAGYPVATCSGPECFTLCAYADNGASAGKHGANPVPAANITAGTVPSSATAADVVSNTTGGACAADSGNAGALVDATGSASNLVTGAGGGSSAFTTASPAYIGEDLELSLAPNAPTGASTVTETFTLTAN